MRPHFTIRAATQADVSVLQKLIERSGIGLYRAHGFVPVHDIGLSLGGGQVTVPFTLMRKAIG